MLNVTKGDNKINFKESLFTIRVLNFKIYNYNAAFFNILFCKIKYDTNQF